MQHLFGNFQDILQTLQHFKNGMATHVAVQTLVKSLDGFLRGLLCRKRGPLVVRMLQIKRGLLQISFGLSQPIPTSFHHSLPPNPTLMQSEIPRRPA